MILAGRVLVEVGPGRVGLRRGAVRLEHGVIAEVVLDREANDLIARASAVGEAGGAGLLGGPEWLIAPGFADAHVHLPQFDSIGRAGLTLLDWLDTVIFPAEARWADAEYAAAMARRVARQLLAHGTTAVGAYATVHHDATRAAMSALAEAGVSGLVGQVLMDRGEGSAAALIRPRGQLLDEAASLAPIGRIRPAVTPRFALSCTPELLAGAGELAARTGWIVQTHLAETRAECDLVVSTFDGRSYVGVYADAGLLRRGAIFGHGIHLDAADRAEIARAGAVVAHCPLANTFLRSGEMRLREHAAAGVRVALGSDVAGGYERSMVRVARAALETAARQDPELAGFPHPDTAAWAWWQITAGNADVLGLTGAGRLVPGAPGDVLAIRADISWLEAPDPLAALLWAWDDRWLRGVWTAGVRR